MSIAPLSHAFVLPGGEDFFEWYQAIRSYLDHFPNISVIRGSGGTDLNRYRNITAIDLPRMWLNNDATGHIRRIFPSVVLVDRIIVDTPQQLTDLLSQRLQQDDRFGQLADDSHIDERFVLAWCTDYRPYNVTSPFTKVPTGNASDVLGLEIEAKSGAKILAGADGTVSRTWTEAQSDDMRLGKYIQVETVHDGITYTVTYAGLSDITVSLDDTVRTGQHIGQVDDDKFLIIVQAPNGNTGYRIPNIVDPNSFIYIDGLRVRPTSNGLRVRQLPRVDSDVLDSLHRFDFVVPREQHGRVLSKTGQEGTWISVRLPDGRNGYAAAWFLEATDFQKFALEVNPLGVNLDVDHPLGQPSPERLGNLGWVRFNYNVSRGIGSEDIIAAYNRYAPIAEAYAEAGYHVCFTTSHQTYGEAKGFPPWEQMEPEQWYVLIDRFAEMMGRIAQQWQGSGLVHCWQIWNEPDTQSAVASVPMSAPVYGRMLDRVLPAIKSQDDDVYVVTGGLASGPELGTNYIRTALNATPQGERLDGVAFHPYGRGTNLSSPYSSFGHIDQSILAYSQIFTDKPLWITEWGVLDYADDNPTDIANYAANFINHVKSRYPGQIAALIWYAWAEGMHNGYGLIDAQDQPRPPLTDRFMQA